MNIKQLLIDLSSDINDDDTKIPLPNVTSFILEKVIDYLKHHNENPDPVVENKDEKWSDNMSTWDKQFCNVEQSTLFELILVRCNTSSMIHIFFS